jgi:serine/threonine protein kinase
VKNQRFACFIARSVVGRHGTMRRRGALACRALHTMPLARLAAIAPSLPGMMLPAQIGKYRVKSKLGEGSTSEVFLAHDPFRDRDVAIKRVRTGVFTDPRELHYQQRFFAAEAAWSASCTTPMWWRSWTPWPRTRRRTW